MKRKRTIAIGDIHGCIAALETVMNMVSPDRDDTIVMLGDYVDRGPHSCDVVDLLLDLMQQCRLVPLMGNHELMLLNARKNTQDVSFWLSCGGAETLMSYGCEVSSIPQTHIDFFENCSMAYETETHLFIHANYDPQVPIDGQDEDIALWRHLNFGVPGPHISGKTAVVGHTPQVSGEILDVGHLVCIDTHCFGSGWLTAMDVQSKTVWQANREGLPRS